MIILYRVALDVIVHTVSTDLVAILETLGLYVPIFFDHESARFPRYL